MNKMELYKNLKEAYSILQDGLQGEFDGYKDTDDQPDARLIEASVKLEEIIDTLLDEITNDASNNSLKINIGEDNTEFESGVLKISKDKQIEIDKINDDHVFLEIIYSPS